MTGADGGAAISDGRLKPRVPWFVNSLLLLTALSLACALGEGFLRLFYAGELAVEADERVRVYRYDERLGWFPVEHMSSSFSGASRTVHVSNNERGFRDIKHRASGRPGMLFLGDSFVWGYDVEADDRFTDKLRSALPDWEIYNLGVSGYGTDQELLLLERHFDYYQPRIVFLVFCTQNDFLDNAANFRYGYYKPYFELRGENLELRGVPVPHSLTYFARRHSRMAGSYLVRLVVKVFSPAVVSTEPAGPSSSPVLSPENPTFGLLRRISGYVSRRGARFVVGLERPHLMLERFLRSEGIPYLQLDGAERFDSEGYHWTPAGHTAVSEAVLAFLERRNLLDTAGERRQ